MKSILLIATVLASIPGGPTAQQGSKIVENMNNARLGKIIQQNARNFQGKEGFWEFEFSGVEMACLTDAEHDRMRIIAPITKVAALKAEQRDKMLEANFHSALDARYAISKGVVWAAYIHPLSALQESEVQPAMQQVAGLVQTFGTTYSSSDLVFRGTSEK